MSIRVMIVEDEAPILRSIKKMINECDSEFNVCHTTKNGAEAMAYLQKESVDIIFTDIRMPLVDGLELIEMVYNEYPSIYIIVLSGYQDFEYAKHALKHNAFDYMLKPTTCDEMSKVLEKLKTAYNQRTRQEKTSEILANLHLAQRDGRKLSHSETYLVMLLCAGPAPIFDNEDIFLPGSMFWYELEELHLNEDKNWLFMGKTPVERVLIRELTDLDLIKESTQEVFTTITSMGSIPLTLLYFDKLISFSGLGEAIRLLQHYLPSKQQVGVSLLCQLDSIYNLPKESYFSVTETNDLLSEQTKFLTDSLIMENNEGINSSLVSCLDILKNNKSSYVSIQKLFDNVLSRYENVKVLQPDIRILVYEAVYQALSYDELKQNLISLFENLQAEADSPKIPKLANKVRIFLDESFRKPVTGADLSKEFGFVSSYISRVFRQGYGYSPAHYMTMLRIDEAKRLLREQPDLLIKEVAVLVGFKDQYHFSKTFKKEVGFWPTDFRG